MDFQAVKVKRARIQRKRCIKCSIEKENIKANSENIPSFYAFPKDPSRREEWIRRLNLNSKEVKNHSLVCQIHFARDQFIRTRLKPDALPSSQVTYHQSPRMFSDTGVPFAAITISTGRSNPSIKATSAPKLAPSKNLYLCNSGLGKDTSIDARLVSLNRLKNIRLKRMQLKQRRQQQIISRLRLKVQDLKARLCNSVDLKKVFRNHPIFQQFFESQVDRYSKLSRKNYTSFEKNVALSMYYSSGPNGYRTLQKIGFKLPARGTLQKWISDFRTFPGINQPLLEAIKQVTSTFDESDKDCLLTWDEMSVKELIEYNKFYDCFEGITDFGSQGRKLKLANEALVFMIRGINSNWKFPISFYFSRNATPGSVLKSLVLENIASVQDIGLRIRIAVCDMSFTNQSLYKSLGINQTKPFIDVRSQKIYFVHDMPHLLKLIRNNLIKHNFVIKKVTRNRISKQKVKWSHISSFYSKDTRTVSRMAPRLTPAHVYLKDYSKMKVKLAAQILSNSVFAGMMTMVRLKMLKSEAAVTAKFIKKVDEMFDFFNMSCQFDVKPGRSAFFFYQNVCKFDEFASFLKSVTIPSYKNKAPEFLQGLILTVLGIKGLALDLQEEGYKYLYTRNLQQDCLEQFFAFVRSKNGFCLNPTCRTFRTTFRYLFFATLVHTPETGNTECLQEEFTKYYNNMQNYFVSTQNSDKNIPLDQNRDENDDDVPIRTKIAATFYTKRVTRNLKLGKEQEKSVSSYMGAACIYAINKLNNCDECSTLLITRSAIDEGKLENYVLIDFKQFDVQSKKLFYLGESEINFFEHVNSIFLKIACRSLKSSGFKILDTMFEKYVADTDVINWLQNCSCFHREKILKYFLKAKIFRLLKDKNEKHRQIKSWGQKRGSMLHQ